MLKGQIKAQTDVEATYCSNHFLPTHNHGRKRQPPFRVAVLDGNQDFGRIANAYFHAGAKTGRRLRRSTYMRAKPLGRIPAGDAGRFHPDRGKVFHGHSFGLASVKLPHRSIVRGDPGFADVILSHDQRKTMQKDCHVVKHGRCSQAEGILEL